MEAASSPIQTPIHFDRESGSSSKPVTNEMRPQLKRPGYETEPSMVVLAELSREELESVENFAIQNKQAKIIFERTQCNY